MLPSTDYDHGLYPHESTDDDNNDEDDYDDADNDYYDYIDHTLLRAHIIASKC